MAKRLGGVHVDVDREILSRNPRLDDGASPERWKIATGIFTEYEGAPQTKNKLCVLDIGAGELENANAPAFFVSTSGRIVVTILDDRQVCYRRAQERIGGYWCDKPGACYFAVEFSKEREQIYHSTSHRLVLENQSPQAALDNLVKLVQQFGVR